MKIAHAHGPTAISWDARTELLERLAKVAGAQPIIDAFLNAGTSRPVELTVEQRGLLYRAINEWSRCDVGGLHPDLWALRSAIAYE